MKCALASCEKEFKPGQEVAVIGRHYYCSEHFRDTGPFQPPKGRVP
jgi:hypothetical protein